MSYGSEDAAAATLESAFPIEFRPGMLPTNTMPTKPAKKITPAFFNMFMPISLLNRSQASIIYTQPHDRATLEP